MPGFLIFVLIGSLFSINVSAQAASGVEKGSGKVSAQDEGTLQSAWRDFASPFDRRVRPYLIGGTLVTLVALSLEHSGSEATRADVAANKPLGANSVVGNRLGQWIPNLVYVSAQLLDAWLLSEAEARNQPRRRALVMLKSTLYASVAALSLKYAVQEPRPDGSDNYSFPSGHSATAFAFASVVGAEHPWYFGVPAYLAASFVAFSRINDNRHRFHDIAAGATLGVVYGLGLYYRSLDTQGIQSAAERSHSSNNFYLLPTDGFRGFAAGFSRSFH